MMDIGHFQTFPFNFSSFLFPLTKEEYSFASQISFFTSDLNEMNESIIDCECSNQNFQETYNSVEITRRQIKCPLGRAGKIKMNSVDLSLILPSLSKFYSYVIDFALINLFRNGKGAREKKRA